MVSLHQLRYLQVWLSLIVHCLGSGLIDVFIFCLVSSLVFQYFYTNQLFPFRGGNITSLQILLIISTCFTYIVAAYLFSKAVG